MTANAFEEDVEAALEAGMDAHIAKACGYWYPLFNAGQVDGYGNADSENRAQ